MHKGEDITANLYVVKYGFPTKYDKRVLWGGVIESKQIK